MRNNDHTPTEKTGPAYSGDGSLKCTSALVAQHMQGMGGLTPMIKATDEGAAPHNAEPTSNRNNDHMNTHLGLNRPYTLPKESWRADEISKLANFGNEVQNALRLTTRC
jgi:hypothetical protein